MHDLGTLGGPSSNGYAINARGQITGSSDIDIAGIASTHAFLYSDGTMQDLGVLGGGLISVGLGINASGQVAGWSYNSGYLMLAFLYSDGTMQDLGTLGGAQSEGYGINASGQVTGSAAT
jgi:probable HAF family extracellular repeat protein